MKLRGCMFRIALVLLVIVAIVCGGLWYVYQSAQRLPEFYQAALEVDTERYEVAGDEFESQLAQLNNDLQQAGRWEATFTEEQINGWLATDLPVKFPNAVPGEVSEPRVSITKDLVSVAFRLKSSRFTGIVVCKTDVYCTENSNQIAVRIDDVRAGVVSLPLNQWLDKLSSGIHRAGIKMSWTEENGRPLALVTLPDSELADGDVIVDSIELLEGKVTIRGHTLNGDQPFGLGNSDTGGGN